MIRFGVRYSNWGPYSVLMIELLKYISIKICHGSYSFDCLLKALLQKRWSSSPSLNCYIHLSVESFPTNHLVLKFCDACLAGRSHQEGSRDYKSVFKSSWSFLNKHQSFALHILLLFEKRICALSLISALKATKSR